MLTANVPQMPVIAGIIIAAFVFAIGTLAVLAINYVAVRHQVGRTIQSVSQSISRLINFLLVICIGFGVPALVIHLWGGADILHIWWPPTSNPAMAALGRSLQLVFIAIASTLPALLYFLFSRQQLATVRQTFFREVMMLDPNLETIDEATIKYEQLVNQIYGSGEARSGVFGAGLPIVISTLLLTIGWTLTLVPVGTAADMPPGKLASFFIPHPTALNFGFLGAYFFAINLIFRRYVRGDLTPKAYNHITVRILVTVIVVWVVEVVSRLGHDDTGWTDSTLFAVAFLIGIFPETGATLVQDFVRQPWLGSIFPSLKEEHPLTNLEGMNLYDRARMLEEGIENVENLAHAHLIELMLRTRIPTARLVDMFDQAALYLRLGHDVGGIERDRGILRAYGIRTATDVEEAYAARPEAQSEAFLQLLDGQGADLGPRPDAPASDPGAGPTSRVGDAPRHDVHRLCVILDTLSDAEWMPYLRHWREVRHVSETVFSTEDFYKGSPAGQTSRSSV